MKNKLLLSFVLLLCTVLTLGAQVRRITGKVISADDGTAIAGVTVRVVASTSAGQTDGAGNFALNVPTSAKNIEFHYVGYRSLTIDITGTDYYEVSLVPTATTLDEVVVGAVGLETKAREQGTQQTRISGKVLTQGKPINVAAGLHAKVPGLQVNAVSSGVNPTVRLVLRGNRSILGDNTALLVVDNSIVPSSVLGNINPEDVESINVLNGAGAAALYGSQGSNGAIIITTKKGKTGSTDITLGHTATFEKVSFQPKLQEKFGAGADSDLQIYTPYENQQYGPRFDGSIKNVGQTLEDGSIQTLPYSPVDDRYKFWETGKTNQTDLSVSSGDEKGTQYVSLQHVDVSGTTYKDKYNRFGIRANGTRNVYDNVKVGYNINYIQNRYNITNNTASMYENLLNTPANIPVTAYKDWQNDKFANPNGYYNNYYENPYFEIDNYRQKTRNDYLTGNVEFNWKVVDWFSLIARGNLTTRNQSFKNTTGKFTYSNYVLENFSGSHANIPGGVSDGSFYSTTVIGDINAIFTKKVDDFGFRFTLGNQIINRHSKSLDVSINGLVIPGLYNISNRSDALPNGSESNSTSREIGLWGQFVGDYKNFLFVTLNGRNDWVSVLDKNNRSFFYPTADVSFIATDAIEALKDNEVLNVLKLRAGWSKSGNVNLSPYGLLATFGQARGFPYEGTGAGFTIGSTMVAEGLKPEITEGVEVGFDATFLRRRVNASFTYYQTNTTNQIIPTGVSQATGYVQLRQNVGLVKNKGIESSLDLNLYRTSNWNVTVGGNYTWLWNIVDHITPDLTTINVSTGGSAQAYAIEGEQFPILRGTVYEKDDQGRIIVDSKTGYPKAAESPELLGRLTPKHRIGLNTYITYKNFALSAVAEYRGGYYIYNNGASTYDFSGSSIRTTWYDRDRFVIPNSVYMDEATGQYVENTNVTVKDGGSGFWSNGSTNRNIAENYVYSGDFWKIREIALGFTVPSGLLANAKYIKGAQISLQGRNLFIWTPKSNIYTDPEYSFSDGNAVGITTLGQTPPSRYFGGTVTLRF